MTHAYVMAACLVLSLTFEAVDPAPAQTDLGKRVTIDVNRVAPQ